MSGESEGLAGPMLGPGRPGEGLAVAVTVVAEPKGETAAVSSAGAASEVAEVDEATQVVHARTALSRHPTALALLEYQLEHGCALSLAAKAVEIDYYTALSISRSAAYRLVLRQELQSELEHGVGEATRVLLHLARNAKSETVKRQAASDLLKRSHSALPSLTADITLDLRF